MAENNEGWEVWAERLPNVETKQELPEGVWEDYKKYQMLNNREGDWSAPEMKNPDALTKIRNLMGKVKDLPDTMSYYAHKVADPMYANVDYMGQQVGDWAAKKINNLASYFDVSPEARQYGRIEREEYNPDEVDVRFGKNAYKEGYDNLGDYLEAKDQEKVDRYRGYNHANRFAPIENADDKFYTLSDTQTMEDWQPETTSGKIAKGAITTAGDMLPENLKALMEEKGIEGGAKMLGALAPFYKRQKELWQRYKSDPEFAKEVEKNLGGRKPSATPVAESRLENIRRYANGEGYTPEQIQRIEKYREGLPLDEFHEAIAVYGDEPEMLLDVLDKKVGIQLKGVNAAKPLRRHKYSGVNAKKIKQLEKQSADAWNKVRNAETADEATALQKEVWEINDQIRELQKTNTPKPLPNPQAQRAEAIRKNMRREAEINDAIAKAEGIAPVPNAPEFDDYGFMKNPWWEKDYVFKADPNGAIEQALIKANPPNLNNFYDLEIKDSADVMRQLHNAIRKGDITDEKSLVNAFEKIVADKWGYEL